MVRSKWNQKSIASTGPNDLWYAYELYVNVDVYLVIIYLTIVITRRIIEIIITTTINIILSIIPTAITLILIFQFQFQ